jgi:cytochrome b
MMMKKALIWDLPTRLFHWLLVASLVGQYVTAEWMDNAVQWHFYIGYFTLGLIVFRTIWGVIGPKYARFSQFVTGPGSVINYLKTLLSRGSVPVIGHNPLGGWFVIAMLLLVAVQGISGLFMTDDVFLDGPYRQMADSDIIEVMTWLHHVAFDILVYLIALHVGAIVFYTFYKRQPLVPAMIHGKKYTNDHGISGSRVLLAIFIALCVSGILYYAIEIYPPPPVVDDYF